ncbi:MAG: hypothetical protein HOG34_18735 [Bacteroidetes bacterium]|nr:hypothetical protein [Bacteroidota bacterium]MBT4399923.1 hypothetical protein [Bacteroidota bacterium]MBT4410215.1 hypothetical protein [Bacteroidota bacterium]MBT7464989.1 hypothetical protein [Bacteroidota bacterium]
MYISFRDFDGNWQKPQKYGDAVNTVYDERRPFVSSDGKCLFFASDRINQLKPSAAYIDYGN